MPRQNRSLTFVPSEIAYVHTMLKACRNLYLLGMDRKKRRKLLHRRQWFYQRIEHLNSYMGIDLLGFSLMDNHTHFLLRSRPDVVATWDDREIVTRWLTMCPKHRKKVKVNGVVTYQPIPPTDAEIEQEMKDQKRVTELRSRLSDISWWMRLLAQVIAQKANREDYEGEALGHFFKSRFKAVRVRTIAHLLACAMYIDLNPFRALLSESIDGYEDTSAKKRLDLLRIALGKENDKASKVQIKRAQKLLGSFGEERRKEFTDEEMEGICKQLLFGAAATNGLDSVGGMEAKEDENRVQTESQISKPLSLEQRAARAEFLSPILLDTLSTDPQVSELGTRCSDKGFLPISATEYLGLLQWSMDNEVARRNGPDPEQLPSALKRLGVHPMQFLSLLRHFSKCCPREAGRGDFDTKAYYDPGSMRSPWNSELPCGDASSDGIETSLGQGVGAEGPGGTS